MKKYIGLFFVLNLSLFAFGQQEEIDLGKFFEGKYTISKLHFLSWKPATYQYTYMNSYPNDTLWLQDAKETGKNPEILLTTKQLQEAFPSKKILSIPFFEWVDQNTLFFPSLHAAMDVKNKQAADTFPLQGKNIIDYHIHHKLFIAREKDGNVFVYSGKNQYQPVLLCTDTGRHVVFGEAVHRHEWGINEGQYISPQGNYIAFYRMDESMVEDYPLVNTTLPTAKVEPIKYPMAGRENHEVTVGIFDVNQSVSSLQPVYHYIKTDRENDGEFLTNISFSPDERFLYIVHLNRAQDHAKLVEYDLLSGEKRAVILEEKDARYVEPENRMMFLENDRFLWQSQRDGWNHCYLYDISGKLIKQVTSGEWEITGLIGFDRKKEFLYFMTNKDQPVDRYVYSVNLKSGKLKNLTPREGTHSPLFSHDYQFFIDQFTSLETPLDISIFSTKKEQSTLLLSAPNPYRDCRMGKASIFPIRNPRGDSLYCRMILPADFDPTQKYPCFIYVYGGPHSQLVTNTFLSGGIFLHYMAQKGYVVFTLDNRGTKNRGAEFEKCIFRKLGALEMEDQMCGVRYLKSLPFVDSTRMGIDGWSYGGFMTLSLISSFPGVFKSASCGGPVVDWKWYEIMYGERYMDTPDENPDGYRSSSILPKVKNIKSELLVIHGAQDNTVVWQHSLELLRKAIEEGIHLDYFVYPTHAHNVRGKDRLHLWNKIEKFHDTYLK